ncbi:MAG: choloylglycine hydrolase [Eubacteriales bacterium]|nr:choloylglycine hydrolase [Eubacteriales bacterium]
MCTAITLQSGDFYFGRNLDLEYSFQEKVLVTPRKYNWQWKAVEQNEALALLEKNTAQNEGFLAMIGMGNITDNYPLYADACNEAGLAMASLYFPGNAHYGERLEGKVNLAPYELIPFVVGTCKTAAQARELLETVNLINEPFNQQLPVAPLHYIVADSEACYVIEAMVDGMHIHENPYGILTNNPPFPFQIQNLQHYLNLRPANPSESFSQQHQVKPFGQGLGAFGLPGDASPTSRFVRACYHKLNSVCDSDEKSSVSQFFHLLDSVKMARGSVVTAEGLNDITTYSSCINTKTASYYFKTYDNHQINCVELHSTDLDSTELSAFELPCEEAFNYLN